MSTNCAHDAELGSQAGIWTCESRDSVARTCTLLLLLLLLLASGRSIARVSRAVNQ